MNNTVLMLPVYNEKDNLESLVRKIVSIAPNLDILIIEDSSPDGSGEIADKLAREFLQIRVVHRPPKSGRGSCSLEGYKYAIERGYKFYLEMDVDHSHRPEELPEILKAANDADLVIASRFIKGGSVVGWDWKRHLLHFMASVFTRVMLGTPNTDHTNGYRCYSTKLLQHIDFTKLKSQGYCAHSILENVIWRAGYKIKELPSTFLNRTAGTSKMSKHEAINGVKDIINHRIALIKHGNSYFLK